MDYKAAIEAIVQVEQQYDVNSVCFVELKVWPLIRLSLWGQLLKHEQGLVNAHKHSSYLHQFARISYKGLKAALTYIPNWRSHKQQLSELLQEAPVDTLFLSRVEDYTDQVGGRYYSRHIDPIIDLVREEWSFLKLEIKSSTLNHTLPRYEKTLFISPGFYLAQKGFIEVITGNNKITNFSSLETVIKETMDFVSLNEKSLIKQIQTIVQLQALFIQILSILKPKTVFLVCYYSLTAMAIVKACKSLGIKTVDIQHGKQGKYHGLYTHWTCIPSDGYDLLPDYFWCWGQESRENISRWQPKRCLHHQAIVGGSRWLAKWINEDKFDFFSREDDLFFQQLLNAEKVILITLQPFKEPLPELTLEAMMLSPPDWLWLIRLHPNRRHEKQRVYNIILSTGINNFEVDQATSYPLYALLKRSHHHITCFSSVCYEASAFQVPTTIIHPAGLQLYSDYISKGIFTYAQSGQELLSAIKQHDHKKYLEEQVPYIETSKECAMEALKIIFS